MMQHKDLTSKVLNYKSTQNKESFAFIIKQVEGLVKNRLMFAAKYTCINNSYKETYNQLYNDFIVFLAKTIIKGFDTQRCNYFIPYFQMIMKGFFKNIYCKVVKENTLKYYSDFLSFTSSNNVQKQVFNISVNDRMKKLLSQQQCDFILDYYLLKSNKYKRQFRLIYGNKQFYSIMYSIKRKIIKDDNIQNLWNIYFDNMNKSKYSTTRQFVKVNKRK